MSNHNWKEITVKVDNDMWDREAPLEGELIKVEHDIGPNQSKMYTVKTEHGEVKFWGSTVLDDKLLGVPLETFVKIEYEGKIKSAKGTSYHSYKVFIDESTAQASPQDEVHEVIEGEPMNLDEMPPDFLK